ncbi:MAG: hypothetical protein A4E73_01941 [Syntrophaceae bacterium PtaU1.Bin231]|nr:MAG: hypothetical protein A4E73_01941 [Syntrophaceae bacterium PtaU1.Bin231]
MRMTEYQIEQWLRRNRRRMIKCPYQPGNLRITLWGCKQRKLQARREDFTDLMKGDYFDYVYKSNLLRCRDCPIAEASSHRKSRSRTHTAGQAVA